MTLELALVLKANAEQAKRTLAEVKASVGETGKAAEAANRKAEEAARKYSQSLEDIRARFNPLFAATRAYEAELNDIAAAEKLGAISAREAADAREAATRFIAPTRQLAAATRELAASQQGAAIQTGSLAAQFNDIGVQLAGGQSPLLIALQQGTQISQALGNAGAGGAVRALGGAFLSLLSPVNLVTIASIAAGGAMLQWLTSSGEEAETLADRIERLSKSVETYESAVDRLLTPVARLREEWGLQAGQVQAVYEAIADLARLDALSELSGTVSQVRGQFSGLAAELDLYRAIEKDIADGVASGFIDPLLIQQSQRELQALQAGLRESFGLTVDQARELQSAIDDLSGADGPAEAANALANLRGVLVSIGEEAGGLPAPLREAAQAILEGELAARQLAGPLSEGRVEAEKLVQGLEDSAAAGSLLASLNIAGGISAALGPAASLAGFLERAASAAYAAAQARVEQGKLAGGGRGADPRTFVDDPYYRDRYFPSPERPAPKVRGSGGGGARAEADSVRELIEKLKEEQALLQETDPLQQALLGHRRELALATAAERKEIEGLVASNLEAKAATEALSFAAQSAGDALIDALLGGKDAGEQLIKTLIKAGLQAALLGQGPLAGLFGGGGQTVGGVGGLLGGLLGGFLKRAGGGPVYGPGTGTSDDVPALLSNGEYVVNARATARYRAVLDAMNGGGLPGFAVGGPVGGGSGGVGPAAGGGLGGRVRIELGEGLVGQILDQARDNSIEVTQTSLTTYHEKVLPDAVRDISNAPRDRR